MIGQVLTDAKIRTYEAKYFFHNEGSNNIRIGLANGNGDSIVVPSRIPIDNELISLLGLYSGDGAKGSEQAGKSGKVTISVSFSQSEPI